MRWHTIVLWCLDGTLNENFPLTAQEISLTTQEIEAPGTPVTDESVKAGLPKNHEALRNSPQFPTNDALTHLRLAEILCQQGDPNGAIKEYQAAIQENPEMAVAFRGLGAIYVDKHEWKKAEQALRKARNSNLRITRPCIGWDVHSSHRNTFIRLKKF